ncbi:RNB domain-containing ribonuclease [Nocardioides marmoriginsengisoli]|uniref:RNB domain-containing ribonuclease n=1 Tax=Nocardioides marmoriginsengisoli TaxID=661483 RepID=A0A3N0CM23_9ACTN|nr:RNB domain-containing ribonuclease [Nocardioides marmoriginsengisoli]RNL64351.1 RNB domain-containing ribonuclease [Nocardioides marmoriginsengisoli]
MSSRVLRVRNSVPALEDGIAAIQQEQKLDPAFPPAVVAEAVASAREPRLPALDRTDLAFITIDPAGSMDLDQAMHLERDGDGFVVHYAIADVAAYVTPGGAIDVEARRRGESLYGAESKIPLHPKELSEGAASLLPEQTCPAFLWTIKLDATGVATDGRVERALVRSVARYDYEGVQKQIDSGQADPMLLLLREIGLLRQKQEAERGGVSLPMPEQVVDCVPAGGGTSWSLDFRRLLPVEDWNAQISLLTGFTAARIMVEGKVGILRTLPPADPQAVKRLRRTARGLGIDWPGAQEYPDFIRSLDPEKPHHLAMVTACTSLLRGAGYAGFNGTVPEQPQHAALASAYAHVTAPLRRLVDRFGLEICAALCAGTPVPAWVLEALPELPDTMRESGRRANAYENAVINLVEAATLQGRIGETFSGVVVEADREDARKGDAVVRDAAVEAPVSGSQPLPIGEELTLTLAEADPATRKVRFTA